MKNQEAARYARWAAAAACTISLVVAGFYTERAVSGYLLRRHGPAPVPASVQQQSADFSYSDVEAGRTIFTVRASHAIQFKDQDLAQLEDVWVTLYGRQGDRNDNIHTRECSYQPKGGAVVCAGEVDIDIQSANPPPNGVAAAPLAQALHVKTSNLTFNRETGEAETPAPVDLTFAGGHGSGAGLHYDAHESLVRVDHGVALQMDASPRTGGMPVRANAESLEFHRDEHSIALNGQVAIREGPAGSTDGTTSGTAGANADARTLTADQVTVGLDESFHVQTMLAQGHPNVRATESDAQFNVAAERFTGSFDASGIAQHIAADGSVKGTRKSATGEDHFAAPHVEFAMLPGENQLKDMTATGGVVADSRQGENSRSLQADGLRVSFAPPDAGRAGSAMEQQRVESAETIGAATIESKTSAESLRLRAARFVAGFAADGRLANLAGHSGVEILRTPASGAPQTSTANELSATFAPGGAWSTLDETGNVKLNEADREATAAHARMVQSTGLVTLDGSPVITDSASQTAAGSVTLDQKNGEFHAEGKVVSTQFGAPSTSKKSSAPTPTGISLGEGAAHISADALRGSLNSGDASFEGNARLWQGQVVLSADRIQIARDKGELRATGSVVGVFPQAAGQTGMPQLPSLPTKLTGQSTPPGTTSTKSTAKPASATGVTLWKIRAPSLTYSNEQAKAHLEGGVIASSDQGSLHSQTLDAFLQPSTAAGPAPPSSATARALNSFTAQGGVAISQGEIQAKADRADYSAPDGKFTLTGGEPTITDGSGNTTTGRSLTFYVASDTISVDSEKGTRTLTKHRVEK